MPIHVKKTPDVYLTASELNRYREQYKREFSMYCGPRPDFDEWVIAQEEQKKNKQRDDV